MIIMKKLDEIGRMETFVFGIVQKETLVQISKSIVPTKLPKLNSIYYYGFQRCHSYDNLSTGPRIFNS